jgi:hypothetical protein
MSVQIKIKESSNNETEVNKGVLVVEVESLNDADPSTASENDILIYTNSGWSNVQGIVLAEKGSFVVGDNSQSSTMLNFSGDIEVKGSLTIGELTYPSTDGTNGQVLVTDGNGSLSFADAGSGGGIITVPHISSLSSTSLRSSNNHLVTISGYNFDIDTEFYFYQGIAAPSSSDISNLTNTASNLYVDAVSAGYISDQSQPDEYDSDGRVMMGNSFGGDEPYILYDSETVKVALNYNSGGTFWLLAVNGSKKFLFTTPIVFT